MFHNLPSLLLILILCVCIVVIVLIVRYFFKGYHKTIEDFHVSENITDSFTDFIESVEGIPQLQVVEVNAKEVFTLTSNSEILWHLVSLPTVKIICTAQVTFIYYISLTEDWHVALTEDTLTVLTPEIQFNKPSINVSTLECDYLKKSILRNNTHAKEILISQLHILAYQRAKQKIPYIRDTARSSIRTFLTSFLSQFNIKYEKIHIGITAQ